VAACPLKESLASSLSAFDLLARPVVEATIERGFSMPTEAQSQAIPHILEGKNVLLISPTASGKTEAALLPILTRLVSDPERGKGIKLLYITPLKALNRDLLDRLQWWGQKLDLRVGVRHGDTETSERARQSKSPPDMLITTPETLQAMMPGRVMKQHLRDIRFVVIDEVHELAEDKRGSQLALGLERLRWITQREFQIVGLSATIGSPEKVGLFLVGNGRPVEIVHVPVARKIRFRILFPEPSEMDHVLAGKLFTHPEVAARLRLMRGMIEGHKSVLLFTNTRSIAEVLASRFKIWDIDFPVSIHHGSLAKPSRITAERGLKDGQLRGLIATSSLELGIDVGRIDYVIQYMSPHQVTRLIQRVGRSGHSIGQMADGVIITMDPDDTLEAMVIARRALDEEMEFVTVPDKPLDVLSHQMAGLLIQNRKWYANELVDMLSKAYPYRNLTEKDVMAVAGYMYSRFPRLAWVSEQDKLLMRPQRIKYLYEYYFNKLSMIPDEKQYLIIDQSNDSAVGVLDEAFVAEHGEPGTKFIVRGSAWKMISIRGDKIYVVPVNDPTGAIPSWVGEEIPVPYEIAAEVGLIRRRVDELRKQGRTLAQVAETISEDYEADRVTSKRAISDTYAQCEMGVPVPSDKLVTVEEWDDFVIVNSHFGTLVNRTLARLVGHLLSDEAGASIGIQQDPYRIVFQSPGVIGAQDVANVLKRLGEENINVSDMAIEASRKTGLFKRRLVHVARRFGAISRGADLSNTSLRQLAKSFENTVIMEETVRETFEKDVDIPNTSKVLAGIGTGEVSVIVNKGKAKPSPIVRVGLERISRRTDLIPTEKMKRILVESAKARLYNEARTLVCTSCWNYSEIKVVKDLSKVVKCPECGGVNIGVLSLSDEDVKRILEKKGLRLSEREKDVVKRAEETGKLVGKFGELAVIVFAARRVSLDDAGRILRVSKTPSDRFFDMILEAERDALKERFL